MTAGYDLATRCALLALWVTVLAFVAWLLAVVVVPGFRVLYREWARKRAMDQWARKTRRQVWR